MKIKNLLLVLFMLSFLWSKGQNKNIQTTFDENKNEGLIIGTICIENKSYSSYIFVYKDDLTAVADYANASGELIFKNSQGDYKEKGKTYYLFSIAKPEGKYKFAKIKIFDNSGERMIKFEVDLDTKFIISKGKTTYLGQLNININDKKYTLEDKTERDRDWFAKKVPQIQF